MTGLRIGYLTANETYTEQLLKIHQYNIACANTTSQRGAYEALTCPQDEVKKMVSEFENTILGNERRILKKHPLFLAILQTITYFCKVNICNASLHKLKL